MATAVLRSQDCLNHRLYLDFYGSRPPPSQPMSRRNPSRSPPQKKQRAARHKPSPRRSGSSDKENKPSRKPALVMGQVTLLKRGEALPPQPAPAARSEALCSTSRMGPEPGLLPKLSDLKENYAGPIVGLVSPAPSSLPFPAFFLKKNPAAAADGQSSAKSEIGTKVLRCLLRLDPISSC